MESFLPVYFAYLLVISIYAYFLLGGFDTGVGLLLPYVTNKKIKNEWINTTAPFWDANETWLVLGVGILLIAFPKAHGVILSSLYLPVFVMLIGLIFRGIAFDFRSKAKEKYQKFWDQAFFGGSLLTALAQGYMLVFYIVGFNSSLTTIIFSLIVSIGVTIGYCLIGANWLIMKTEDDLQIKSVRWAKISLIGAVFCI